MSDLPRVLLCSYEVIPGPTGSSRRVSEYLRALQERFSVVVLCPKTPEHSHIEKYRGARLLRVPVGSGDLTSRLQTYERAVRRQVESEAYAIAHFLDPSAGHALCELKGDHGYRLVYDAQGFPSQELPAQHPGAEVDGRLLARLRRQELYCLMNADRVLTGSELTRSYIQALGVSADLVRVLRAPAPLLAREPAASDRPSPAPLEVLYLGSQVGWQGLTCLLEALALAAAQVPVRLRLAGPRHPEYTPALEALAAERGLQQAVEWLAPVGHDELAALLASADVGVAPLEDGERHRVQGGSVAKLSEYLCAGLPVVASELPLTRERLPAGALFHPPGDARALAAHLVTLARSPSLRRRLGGEGRAAAERELDSARVGAQLLALYDELLGAPQRGAAPGPLTPARRLPPIGGREVDAEPAAQPAAEAPSDPGLAARTPRSAPPPLPPRTVSRTGIPALAPPEPPRSPAPAPLHEEPEELSADEAEALLEEVEADGAAPAPPLAPPASGLTPWLAQVAHGYCPPEGARFTRHTPPTNFPGREDDVAPLRAAGPTPPLPAPRSKPS